MGFQAFAIQMGVSWGLGMLNRAMNGRPPTPPKPRPDDIEFPIAKIGTPVPIVFGTIKIENPILAWADLFAASEVPGFDGLFRYAASCLFALGTPPQQLQPGTGIPWWGAPVVRDIGINDVRVSFAIPGGVLTHGNSLIVEKSLGGDGNGGWFRGYVEFFDGRADQLITNYPDLSPAFRIDKAFDESPNIDRSLVPGFRNQMLLACLCDASVGSDATFGEQAQFPTVAVTVSCVDVDAIGILDANPAWVIYDLICGEVFKLGYPATAVDRASFQVCATRLIAEGNGCSGCIDAETKIEDIINALLAQVDGAIDQDPNTGLIGMRLIRSDYDVDTLPELTIENTIGRPRVTETGWLENANVVDVTFTNRSIEYKQDLVPARRLSNAISQRYRPRPRTVNYPYCMTAVLAGKLAARDAALLCRPLMTVSATVSRELYALRRGDAIKATWPQLTVVDKVFRILDIDRGNLADDAIRLTLVEDVFDNVAGAIDATPGLDDLPILNRFVDEAPRWLVQAAYYQGHITDTTSTRILAAGRREEGQALAAYYATGSRLVGDPYFADDVSIQQFPTTAKVVSDYPYHLEPYDTTTGLVIEAVSGEIAAAFEDPTLLAANIFDGGLVATTTQVRSGANLIRINGEMLAYESVTDLGSGQYRLNNVWRGLHDTTSDDHAEGDIVYWLDFDNVGQTAWGRGMALETQPVGIPIELGNFDAPIDPLTTAGLDFPFIHGRAERVYRGADLNATALESVTGVAGLPAVAGHFKRVTSVEGALDLVWRQRDATVTTVVRGDSTTSYAVPSGASWRVYAQKVGETEAQIATAANAEVSEANILLGRAGHGEIDVLLRTIEQVFSLTVGESWQSARVRVTAHRARNLLADSAGAALDTTAWTQVGGSSSTVATGTSSLEQTAGGKYFRGAVGV